MLAPSLARTITTLDAVVRSGSGSSTAGGRCRVGLGKLSDLQERVLVALAGIDLPGRSTQVRRLRVFTPRTSTLSGAEGFTVWTAFRVRD